VWTATLELPAGEHEFKVRVCVCVRVCVMRVCV
jgi:hypothetical protein